ncbi:MAG: ester cyclase [Chloroflexi bacterium]|nr:ester cyclase [Chloroflexota bacterium]MBV9547246.1 ester cyclase [Chloroflexota bacterium]
MSTEDNKAVFRRWCEVISQNRLDRVEEIIASDEVDHALPPGVPPGLDGLKQIFTLLHTAFPDLQIEIEDLIAEGDKVVGRVTARGTHEGEFMGIAPTGKRVSFTAIDIVRIAGGQIAERWSQADNLALLQQLGPVPAPGQTAATR